MFEILNQIKNLNPTSNSIRPQDIIEKMKPLASALVRAKASISNSVSAKSPESSLKPDFSDAEKQVGGVIFGELAGQAKYPNIKDSELKEDANKILNVILNRQKSGNKRDFGGPDLPAVLSHPKQFQAHGGSQYNFYLKGGDKDPRNVKKLKIVNEVLKEWRDKRVKGTSDTGKDLFFITDDSGRVVTR